MINNEFDKEIDKLGKYNSRLNKSYNYLTYGLFFMLFFLTVIIFIVDVNTRSIFVYVMGIILNVIGFMFMTALNYMINILFDEREYNITRQYIKESRKLENLINKISNQNNKYRKSELQTFINNLREWVYYIVFEILWSEDIDPSTKKDFNKALLIMRRIASCVGIETDNQAVTDMTDKCKIFIKDINNENIKQICTSVIDNIINITKSCKPLMFSDAVELLYIELKDEYQDISENAKVSICTHKDLNGVSTLHVNDNGTAICSRCGSTFSFTSIEDTKNNSKYIGKEEVNNILKAIKEADND